MNYLENLITALIGEYPSDTDAQIVGRLQTAYPTIIGATKKAACGKANIWVVAKIRAQHAYWG